MNRFRQYLEAQWQHPHDPNYRETSRDREFEFLNHYGKQIIEAALKGARIFEDTDISMYQTGIELFVYIQFRGSGDKYMFSCEWDTDPELEKPTLPDRITVKDFIHEDDKGFIEEREIQKSAKE